MWLSTSAIHNGDESHACDPVPHQLLAQQRRRPKTAHYGGDCAYRHRIVSNNPLIMKANAMA